MLRKENRFDAYAYHIAQRDLADPKTYLEEGSWITLDAEGKIIPSDGSKKSFLCLTSNRKYRDNVSSQAIAPKAAYYMGCVEVSVQNNPDADTPTAFNDESTYACLTPLKIEKQADNGLGILDVATDGDTIVAYAMGPVDVTTKTLRIMTV